MPGVTPGDRGRFEAVPELPSRSPAKARLMRYPGHVGVAPWRPRTLIKAFWAARETRQDSPLQLFPHSWAVG